MARGDVPEITVATGEKRQEGGGGGGKRASALPPFSSSPVSVRRA